MLYKINKEIGILSGNCINQCERNDASEIELPERNKIYPLFQDRLQQHKMLLKISIRREKNTRVLKGWYFLAVFPHHFEDCALP
jgi:hypothetical protein